MQLIVLIAVVVHDMFCNSEANGTLQQTLFCHTHIKGLQSICITLQQVEQVFARF